MRFWSKMVQNRSRIGRNRPAMVPQTPGTLLDHFRDTTFLITKMPKIKKTSRRPNTVFFESPFFPKNVKSQWDFLTNRALELKYQGRKVRNQKLIWYKNVFTLYLFYVSSRP